MDHYDENTSIEITPLGWLYIAEQALHKKASKQKGVESLLVAGAALRRAVREIENGIVSRRRDKVGPRGTVVLEQVEEGRPSCPIATISPSIAVSSGSLASALVIVRYRRLKSLSFRERRLKTPPDLKAIAGIRRASTHSAKCRGYPVGRMPLAAASAG